MTDLVVINDDDAAQLVVVAQEPQLLLTEQQLGILVETVEQALLFVDAPSTDFIIGEIQGPAGPVGPAGQGAVQTLTLPTDLVLLGFRVVRLVAGKLVYADSSSACDSVLGLLTATTIAFGFGEVQLAGMIENPAWSWVAGDAVYLGTAGALTQSAPSSGVVLEVGFAISSTQVMIRIQEPVYTQ